MPDDPDTIKQLVESACSETDTGGYPLPQPPTPSPEGYLLLDEIGRGGMGTVHRARDVKLGREVAIKILSDFYPARSSAAVRFVEEARITGQLQHPGIPAVHEVGMLPDGRPFLAMKLIKGRTFDELLKARRRPGDDHGRSLAIFEAIGQAVGYAHAHNVVHRDLKPQNVMVGAFGEVQVMDWGLAKTVGEPGGESRGSNEETVGTIIHSSRGSDEMTRAGSVLGTPAYMPPEQAIGAIEQIDSRSDVFGLGAILCVILTGRPPYVAEDGESTRQLAARGKLDAVFERLDESGAEPELVALCKRCLSPEKANRPRNAGEVALAIAHLRAAAEDRARKAELDQRAAEIRAGEDRKRRRVIARATWTVGAVLAAGTGISVWQAVRADRERGNAVIEAGKARIAEGNERGARLEADREKVEAIRQEKAATATKDFLKSILSLASAEAQLSATGQANPDITLRATLVLAAKKIEGKFTDQPAIEAELRGTIGLALMRIAAYSDAEPFVRAAFDIRERELGANHIQTLESLLTLSVLNHHLGRLDRAADLMERVARGREDQLGPEHPETLSAQNLLGFQWTNQGQYGKAEPLLAKVRETAERVHGADHFHTLFATYSLGVLHHVNGRFEKAEPFLKRAAEGMERQYGAEHPKTIDALNLLGQGYHRRGMQNLAGPLLLRASEVRDRVLGPKHTESLGSALLLAFYYDDTGKTEKAHPLWARVHADRAKLPEWAVNTWMPHWARVRVGMPLIGEKQYAEAEVLLLEGYRAMVKTKAERHPLRVTVDLLVRLYTDWVKPDEAAKWRTERLKYADNAPAPPAK
jgi:eukaryotic-like serine/threonine-protein kinase